LFGVMGALLVSNIIFRAQRRNWQRRLLEQIPDAMGMITRAIRTGLPLNEAMESVARDMPEPTRIEFARVLGDVAIGRGVDEALLRLRDRSGLPEYGFLAVTLSLQSRAGGSLAETLENLGDLVRKRVALAARVKALTAESRIGAAILIAIPLGSFAAMSLIRPEHARFFFDNPTGVNLAIFAAVMSTLGTLIIRTMIRRATED
jgi:tight adherence protein B